MELQYKQEYHARKFLYKSLLNLAWLWSRVRLAISNKEKYYQTTNLLKTWFWFLVCKKWQKEDQSEFVIKSVGNIHLFSCKNIFRVQPKVSAKHTKKKCVSEFPILSALELFLCGLVVFIDMNMHIPTGDKDLKKHSWKKIMQLLWTVVTYLLKKMLNAEMNIILIVLMEFALLDIWTLTADLKNAMQIKQMINFTVCLKNTMQIKKMIHFTVW